MNCKEKLVEARVKAGQKRYQQFENEELVKLALKEHDDNIVQINKYKKEIDRLRAMREENQNSVDKKAQKRIKLNDNLEKQELESELVKRESELA